MSAPRVVLVDDSAEMLSLLTEILRSDGAYHVQQFDGEGTTVEDIERAGPDLVVLDLPFHGDVAAGWDLLWQIRASESAASLVPVIICTGAIDQVRMHYDDIAAFSSVRVLEKPFSVEDFETAVRDALRGQRA